MSGSESPEFGVLFADDILSPNLWARSILDRLSHEGYLPSRAVKLKTGLTSQRGLRRLLQRLGLRDPARRARDRLRYRRFQAAHRFRYNLLATTAGDIIRNHAIPLVQLNALTANNKAVIDYFSDCDLDIWLVIGGGILRKGILSTGKKFINCHKGYLPDIRGLSATHWAILCGSPYGASAHFINEDLDDGPIIARRIYPIPRAASDMEVALSEAYMIGDIAFHAVRAVADGLPTIPNEGGTYYHAIHPALAEIPSAIMRGRGITPGESGQIGST